MIILIRKIFTRKILKKCDILHNMKKIEVHSMPYMMPSATKEEDDKASVAKLCRSAIEQQVSRVLVAPDNLGFAWNCLERTKTKVHVEYKTAGKSSVETGKELIELINSGAEYVEVVLPTKWLQSENLHDKLSEFLESMTRTHNTQKIILTMSDKVLSTREEIVKVINCIEELKLAGLKVHATDSKMLLTLAYRIFDMYGTRSFGIIGFQVLDSETVEDLYRLSSKMMDEDYVTPQKLYMDLPFDKWTRVASNPERNHS